jgi:hypothetical protein
LHSSIQVVRHYERRERQALKVIAAYGDLLEHLQRAREAIAQQLQAAQLELGMLYLERLDGLALANAERLTGFRGFTRRDPLRAMAKEATRLQKTAAAVAKDPRYVRRQFLVGPHGELTRELAERQSLLEPWEQECARFESLDGFQMLLDLNYDTPLWDQSWLSATYWKAWKAGDAICSALGLDDFGDDVLPAYAKVAGERLKWMGQVREVQARIDQVHELVQLHDRSVAALPKLPAKTLGECQRALADHLSHADLALLEQWQQADDPDNRALLLGLRRLAGLQAKDRVLAETITKGVAPLLEDLRARRAKFARKTVKYGRSKYYTTRWDDSVLDLKFEDKHTKMLEKEAKLRRVMDRMVAYDSYERFELSNDPDLWWFEMTGKSPTRFTPGLRSWYERNPNATVRRDPRVDQAAVRQAVAQAARVEDDDLGYLS